MTDHSKPPKRLHPSENSAKRGTKRAIESESKRIADVLRKSVERKRAERVATLGIYSLRVNDMNFGVPYCAVSDHFALLASKEILPLANVYKVGEFCLLDGKAIGYSKPVLVLDNKVL